MNSLKKIMVVLPVLIISALLLRARYLPQYEHSNGKRLLMLLLAILLFYAWVVMGAFRRRQESAFDIILQSSFYVYVFSVLILTGYFIFFNQVSGHHWWAAMLRRINNKNSVNLEPFLFMKRRHLLSYEVVGNFIMLLPLGIYLPLLYRHLKAFLPVAFMAMFLAVMIELMQLATNVRVTDVDDVILNTAGACVGYIIYAILYPFLIKPLARAPRPASVQHYN